MKPTIALLFILLIAAAMSSQSRKFGGGIGRGRGSGGTSGGSSGGKQNKKGDTRRWIRNATKKLDNIQDIINIVLEVIEHLKWNRDSYIDIENACTDCQSDVHVHCTSNGNRDYGEDWLDIENSIRYDFVLNSKQQDLVVTCYVDFGSQDWGHSKGFFAAIIGERCFDCNWRLVNGGKVELKAEDGFVKSYELAGDAGDVGICQGEKCR